MQKYVLILAFIVCVSCGQDDVVNKPNKLITKDIFIDVLAEIQVAESAYLKSTDKPRAKKAQLALNTKAILNEFQLSSVAFDSSMIYYQQIPEEMITIYDSVIVRLERKLSAMEDNKAKK